MSNVEQDQKPVAEVAEAIVKEEKPEQEDVKEALRKVKGVVPEHLAGADVACVLSDGEMRVLAGLMQQSKLFSDWVT